MLVSVAITAILAGVAIPGVIRLMELSEEKTTAARLGKISDGLIAFYRDLRRLPTTGEGLTALCTTTGSSLWQGPYVTIDGTCARTISDARGGSFSYTAASNVSATVTPPNFTSLALTVNAAAVVDEWSQAAQVEIAALDDAAETYRANNGSYPTSVNNLVTSQLGSDYGTDPWGNAYLVNTTSQYFYSKGPDGVGGNADDVKPAGL